MEIDPYCQQQNCSPLNVLFIDVQIGVPPLEGCNYITPRRAGLSATAGLSCYPRDAMLARVFARAMCLSVRHMPVLCPNEEGSVMIFSPSGSPTILVF